MTKFQISMKALSQTAEVEFFHHADSLTFTAIDNSLVRNLREKLLIHTSSGGRKSKTGSEYFLAEIFGRIAYVRIADHWGRFDSRDKVTGDWKQHNWELVGENVRRIDGEYKAVKLAGFIYLKE